MKKVLLGIVCIMFLFSCSVFKKKEKYGCPGSPQAGGKTMDQKIASGEKVKQKKFKVKQ